MKQKFYSLKHRFLVPLTFSLAIVGALSGAYIHNNAQSNKHEMLRNRTSLVANVVANESELVSSTSDLQRLVSALSAERDIVEIIVAEGDPPRILVASRQVLLGGSLDEIGYPTLREIFLRTFTTQTEQFQLDSKTKRSFATRSFRLPRSESVLTPYSDVGVVTVILDTRQIESEIDANTLRLVVAFVIAIVILAIVTYVLLVRLVLSPVKAITHSKNSDEVYDASSQIAQRCGNEIGDMAKLLHETLDSFTSKKKLLTNTQL